MGFSFESFFYKILIDPLLSGLYSSIIENIEPNQNVIDIACGTGALSIAIAKKAGSVRGIDLSNAMIDTARNTAKRKLISNVEFQLQDASDLNSYKDCEFDVAVTTMAVHQFDSELAVKILMEMKRIASKIVVVDYNYPLPSNFSGFIARNIERLAGGDHYRNFRRYNEKAGINYFLQNAGLEPVPYKIKGNGVFLITVCNTDN